MLCSKLNNVSPIIIGSLSLSIYLTISEILAAFAEDWDCC